MKRTYIIVIIIVLIAGALFFGLKGKKAIAPTENINTNTENTSVVGEQMPTVKMPDTREVQVVKEFTITGSNFSLSPSLITVKKGDRVKITFKNSQGFHDFVINEFGVATKQAQAPDEEILEFTADKVGSFEYYCSVGSHRAMGMKGILKVE